MSKIEYTSVEQRLNEFNKINKSIKIKLDTYENMKNELNDKSLYYHSNYYKTKTTILILSLFCNSICASTITCDVFETHISISSKTNDAYIGRKYNLLLRSMLIIICNLIKINNKKSNTLKSYAINPISEQSLQKYFNVTKSKEEYIYEVICGKQNKKKANDLLIKIYNEI